MLDGAGGRGVIAKPGAEVNGASGVVTRPV